MPTPSKIKLIEIPKGMPLKPSQTTKVYYRHGESSLESFKLKGKRKNQGGIKEVIQEFWLHWTLKRSLGEIVSQPGDVIFQPMGYEQDIHQYLTSKGIVDILNSEITVLFEYSPQEDDMLCLHINYIHNPESTKGNRIPSFQNAMAFIYKNKTWTINEGFNHIHHDYEPIKSGVAEVEF